MLRAILKFKSGSTLNVKADRIELDKDFVVVKQGDKLIARIREEIVDAYYLIKTKKPEVKQWLKKKKNTIG